MWSMIANILGRLWFMWSMIVSKSRQVVVPSHFWRTGGLAAIRGRQVSVTIVTNQTTGRMKLQLNWKYLGQIFALDTNTIFVV